MKLEKIEFSLNQSRLAYESLEKEYLTTVQRILFSTDWIGDAKKIESLQLNLDESKKMVLTLKVNLDNLTNRDKEKTSTISDLVKMVKDLKSQSDSAIQFHKNNIVQLQNELLGCKQQIQDQCKSGMDLDALIGKLEKVKGELSEAVQRERNLVTEKERLNKKIEELVFIIPE
ncbi:hypothetical protein BC833DRAFT_94300 [Globomyces pollinis-pini]|nr:hypothetical protein BC833DRAFT_94300 [Globomyces pollinis-pini]